MVLLLRITVFYLAVGALVITVFRDNPVVLIAEIAARLPASLSLFYTVGGWSLPIVGVTMLFVPREDLVRRLSHAVLAIFLTTMFFLVFTMLKTTMPNIIPFWADPLMAGIDRAIHFGHDPWALTHMLQPWINAEWAGRIYFSAWAGPAMFLPVLLILIDGNTARVNRFIWLYAFAWIVLGNLLALAFLSVGPVYYDRLLGGDAFAGLTGALAGSGVTEGPMGVVQERLWSLYTTGAQDAGSGISAFPSVHIAMISVIALYVAERWRWLAPVSGLLVLTYLFLSVYLGWHYAIDGYVSLAAVSGAWVWLRRRERAGAGAIRKGTASAGAPVAAE